MHSKIYIFIAFIFSCIFSFAQPKIKLDTFAIGYSAPIDIANDGFSSRVFIAQQNGIIWTVDSNGTKLDTFLDIRSKVQYSSEEGFLGLAFHPDFQHNGYFYTYYTKKNTTDNLVARYKVTANPNRATKDSELIVINFSHPGATNHNGGCIKFGKDGYLYIGLGDGGGGGDPNGNGQNKNAILGKLLRLDVNRFDTTYRIPPTNPFVGQANVKKEIWAYGLRNPWRYSFDRETGDIWLADVGQDAHEEVNFHSIDSSSGENYGWRCYEGVNTYNTSGCNASNYKFPFFTYGHNGTTGGFAVTGGFIYKGAKYADFRNYYIFADYVTGIFWLTKRTDNIFTTAQQTAPKQTNISSFGEDIRGELYATNLSNGVIYKLRERCTGFKIQLVQKINPLCFNSTDGSIQLTIVGNNGVVNYAWSNAGSGNLITGLNAGKYVVTATDAIGCVRKDSFVLVKPDTLKINLVQLARPSCPDVSNGLIEVQGSGGNDPYNYTWSNGNLMALNNNLSNGKYVVTLKDSNNCMMKDSFLLVNQDTLDKPIITLNGNFLQTTSGFSYRWFVNGNLIASTQDTIHPDLSISAYYGVEITDANGCKALSDSIRFFVTSVKNKNAAISTFSLFPNPVKDNLTIDIRFNATKKSTLQLINSIGQVVYTEQLQGKEVEKTISLQSLPKGIYELTIITDEGQISTQNFVKE